MTATATLRVTPVSPVACDLVVCRQSGILWATVVVKATFQLVPGEAARPISPLPLVTQDESGSGGGSLVRARETAPHMPRAGVVLTGHAHAPDGRAVPSMSVRLGVAREQALVDKTLHVFGSRAIANPSTILPYQKMPIVYERAFGGAGVWDNPVGTGGPGSRALPNVVDPKDPRKPAGFGPISGSWAPRRGLLGGADASVLSQEVFEAPRGFDWRYFQPAPLDQQLDAFRGNEWIVLDGMCSEYARVQSGLPQARAMAVRRLDVGPDQPISLTADMLVIDADALSASLVWRGRFAVESLDALRSMTVLAGLALSGRGVDWPKRAPALQRTSAQAPHGAVQETQEVNIAALLGGSLPFSEDRGSAPSPLPSQAQPSASFATGTAMVDLERVFQRSVPFSEAVATSPSAMAVPTPLVQKPTPMSTGTTDINLAEILKSAAPFEKRGAPAPATPSAPPVPIPSILAVESPPPALAARGPSASGVAAPQVIAPLPATTEAVSMAAGNSGVRARVLEELRERKSLDGLKLVGGDLHDLDFRGVSLNGHDLRRANLRGANLTAVDLSGARLSDANLTKADLSRADLGRADLRGAVLDEASCADIDAPGSIWDKASLTSAVFLGAKLHGASFEGASLDRASFTQADLTSCNFQRAHGIGIDFRAAKMEAGDLRQAQLTDAIFDDADLRDITGTRADLSRGHFFRADLSSANLRAAALNSADFTQAKTDEADLRDAEISGIKIDPTAAKLLKLRFPR